MILMVATLYEQMTYFVFSYMENMLGLVMRLGVE